MKIEIKIKIKIEIEIEIKIEIEIEIEIKIESKSKDMQAGRWTDRRTDGLTGLQITYKTLQKSHTETEKDRDLDIIEMNLEKLEKIRTCAPIQEGHHAPEGLKPLDEEKRRESKGLKKYENFNNF